MAKNNRPAKPQPKFRGFVNTSMNEEKYTRLRAWAFHEGNVAEGIDKLVSDGYKVAISPDDYHDCVQCVISRPDVGHANEGLFLVGRGKSAYTAVKAAFWWHYTVFDGEWPAPKTGLAEEWLE